VNGVRRTEVHEHSQPHRGDVIATGEVQFDLLRIARDDLIELALDPGGVGVD
jgi:hypothetical protein